MTPVACDAPEHARALNPTRMVHQSLYPYLTALCGAPLTGTALPSTHPVDCHVCQDIHDRYAACESTRS